MPNSIFLFTDYAHLIFFGTANANLLLYPDYFLYRNSMPYQELVMKTQNMLTKAMQQQQQSKVYNRILLKVILETFS